MPGWGLRTGQALSVAHRDAPGTTMVVLRDPGEVYVLRPGFGDERPPGWSRSIRSRSRCDGSRRTYPAVPCGRAASPPMPMDRSTAIYRTLPGQTYGWDAVIALGAAWFLDDGKDTDRFNGALGGVGISESPTLHSSTRPVASWWASTAATAS